MPQELSPKDAQKIRQAFERISARGWGVALGTLTAIALFLATAVLVLRGGPNPGPHLGLLGQYLPGYEVTWAGAFIGLLYGFLLGFGAGLSVGTLYNRIATRG